jgi:hypothetical protein
MLGIACHAVGFCIRSGKFVEDAKVLFHIRMSSLSWDTREAITLSNGRDVPGATAAGRFSSSSLSSSSLSEVSSVSCAALVALL